MDERVRHLLKSIGVEPTEADSARVLRTGPQQDYLGNARRMETEVWIDSKSGIVFGKTRTWTKEAFRGYTDGVALLLVDGDEAPIERIRY